MQNAPATFQWLINQVTAKVNGYEAYIDDIIIYSGDCSDHVKQINVFWYAEGSEFDNQSGKKVNLVVHKSGHMWDKAEWATSCQGWGHFTVSYSQE